MIKVVIVDDLEIMRESVKMALDAAEDIECIGSFSNAEDFMDAYKSLMPDITIMDIDLPGISGIAAIQQVKSYFHNARFLVLTIFNDDEKIFNALKAGAGGYLLKKHIFNQLVDGVKELHGKGAPMSPEVARKVMDYFSRNNDNAELTKLTEREKVVLQYIVDGYLYKEMAAELFVTIDAIKKHAHNIYEKLEVRSRSEAIRKFYNR